MEELTRGLRNLTEELREFRAKTEQNIEELRRELKISTQTIEELKQLRGSTECEKGARADNTKRPFFKKIKGIFSSSKSKTKKKKKGHSTEHEVDDDDDIPNIPATFRGSQMRRTRGSNGWSHSDLSVVDGDDDIPNIPATIRSSQMRRTDGSKTGSEVSDGFFSPYDGDDNNSHITATLPGRQMRRTRGSKRGSDVSDVDDDDDDPLYTFGRRQLRRTRGSRSGSEVSIGIFFTSRQSSTKSFRNLSFDDNEDPDDIQESLRIVQHPTHQTHKEGSRVVFECKAQGKKNLTYQWLKDGTNIQGQQSCTLVLDSVKVRDFGGYSCKVSYAYAYVESSNGELDVMPRDGMRFKFLDEAFQEYPHTQQKVEKLLVKKIPGGGGWRQVAFKWKMDIDDLERSHEEGKGVISYLKATYPDLTVYDFCKTLKEPNIKRFDIIKELLVHLVSVPQEQFV